MSLKAFHILFISVSTVLSAVFALWCFREFARTDQPAALAGGVLGAVGVAALLVYGVRFVKRARRVGLL